MQCSKVISKDVRAVRNDCTTQEPRRALRITRLLLEILLLCLRRTRLARKSTENRAKNHRKNCENSIKNDEKSVLAAFGRSGSLRRRAETRSARARDAKVGRLGRQVDRLGRHVGRLGRQIGSPDVPNSAGDHPGTLFEHVRKLERRSHRFFVVFQYVRGRPEPQFSCASAMFC